MKEKLKNRVKCQTIRMPRKRAIRIGEKAYLYWHLRQKDCEKLGEGIITKIERKTLREITELDAYLDGFRASPFGMQNPLEAFNRAMATLHPGITLDAEVDIITWRWIDKA